MIGGVLLLLNQHVADRVIRCLDAIAFLVADRHLLDAPEPGVNDRFSCCSVNSNSPLSSKYIRPANQPAQLADLDDAPVVPCSRLSATLRTQASSWASSAEIPTS
jgi:hypothetical protein